ncbi:MAG: chemotaxis response regulator protein-glutamate methylesterase [Planctomycetes bacterium]|nr:chemotaxis response regulator protein-glutamate methylesterase [Planctomycetota bacterium]
MNKTRILVVDDSALVRKLVSEVLAGEPDLEVAGTAPNGKIALVKIGRSCPDLVTLDVEMPEMDGLETLRVLRRSHPALPVIMLSSLTERGASATVDSLLLGARDYVAKPSGLAPWNEAARRLREELVAKIRALRPAEARPEERQLPAPPSDRPQAGAAKIVVVGASTGGPNALTDLLHGMPPDFSLPILIVQHMPPIFTRMLADRLSAKSGLTVREAQDGEGLRPGLLRVAPGDFHLETVEGLPSPRLRVARGPLENSCRPSVDVLFRSAARTFGPGVLGIMLTGMGQDGLQGAGAVRRAGGRMLVQDEASSVVWGMPGAVARAGLADAVLPPDQIRFDLLRTASIHPGKGDARG